VSAVNRIQQLVSKAKAQKGPFFVARLALRVSYDIASPSVPDTDQHLNELKAAFRDLGYEPTLD
jgi:hypothetical protein